MILCTCTLMIKKTMLNFIDRVMNMFKLAQTTLNFYLSSNLLLTIIDYQFFHDEHKLGYHFLGS